jgi:hypothetical protein
MLSLLTTTISVTMSIAKRDKLLSHVDSPRNGCLEVASEEFTCNFIQDDYK